MATILNLTQHNATDEQVQMGVVNLPENLWSDVKGMLTFQDIPSRQEMEARAKEIAEIAFNHQEESPSCVTCMVGGAPFFMSFLERALKAKGLYVVYAFSRRESTEVVQEDGSVKKMAVFRHVGFVEV